MKKVLSSIFILGLVLSLNAPLLAQRTIGRDKTVKTEKVSVKYGNAKAYTDGNGVWIEWQTEAESNNLGFYVFRVSGDSTERINKGLVSGGYMRGLPTTPGEYSYFDAQGNSDSVYYLQSLDTNNRTVNSAMISPQPVEDLTVFAGASSESLKKASTTANPDSVQTEKELPDDLRTEVSVNALQADAVTQRWVAAQTGVKIGVTKEGIYRVSRAELQNAGFDVNASSTLWQLYLNGVQQSINVGAGGNYIEFYGRGINTVDTETQIYYLVVGAQNGKRIATTSRRSIGGQVLSNSFTQSFTRKDHFQSTNAILNGDAENFFGATITNTPVNVTFNLPKIDFSVPNATVDIGIQGLTMLPHQTRVVLNGTDIGAIIGELRNLATRHYDVPTSLLLSGVNTLQFNTQASASDISLFESVKVSFARQYQVEQNQLSFYTQNYKASNLEGFTSANVRVFDITYSDSPTLIGNLPITQSNGAYRVQLPANRGRVMFAVEDSAILQAASITQNTPSTLSTVAHNADLIIVTYKDWITQANDWATYRRTPGTTVEVVNIEDVYDEFNFGAVSALSIRSFLQYAKTNWQTAPRYVLLIGDATYDPKNYTGAGNFNFVPTKLVDTVEIETASDDTLADFNDDGLADISIGRAPARNAVDVTQLLNKTKTFELTSAQGFGRGTIFASDQPLGWDFQATSNRLRDLLPPGTNSIMINEAEVDAKNRLLTEMNNGRFFINYAGHGSTAAWTSRAFFNKTDAAALSNGNNLSVFTLLTCLNGYFIPPQAANESLAEVLLKAQNGGAAAVWASTGATTPDIQEIMATRFYQQLTLGNLNRLGDLVNDAKTTISGGRDVRLSWALLGDPMLKVR